MKYLIYILMLVLVSSVALAVQLQKDSLVEIQDQNVTYNITQDIDADNITTNSTCFIIEGGLYAGEYCYSFSTNTTIGFPGIHYINSSYYNYTRENKQNITRDLGIYIEYICINSDPKLKIYINNTLSRTDVLDCSNTSYNTSYRHTSEGLFNISLTFNTSETETSNIRFSNFTSDLYNPAITYLNFTYNFGLTFINLTNVTMICSDNISYNLTYNITFNNLTLYYNLTANNTNITNETSLTDGLNTLIGGCSDYFGTTTRLSTRTIYIKNVILIDEIDNTLFNLDNVTTARVYFDDNSTFYDFKVAGQNNITISSDTPRLRFEFTYTDGTRIPRFIDLRLIENEDLRVCVNKEGITHIEQLIISSQIRKVLLENQFSTCYVGADYTRFAYQEAFLLKAYTIDSVYYLYVHNQDDERYILAGVDGSISAFINLDTIEFSRKDFSIGTQPSTLTTEKVSEGLIKLKYINLQNDSIRTQIQIYRMDTSLKVFDNTYITNANDITAFFDYSVLSNVTNETVFKASVSKTTLIGESSFNRYFNVQGKMALFTRGLAIAIAIGLTIFGLTLTAKDTVFGWFGIITNLISIVILTLCIGTWYTLFFQSINAIMLVFCGLIMVFKNPQTVSG